MMGNHAFTELRKVKGLLQKDLAESLGISPYAMSRIEAGKSSLPQNLVGKLCEILSVSEDELVRSGVRIKSPVLGNNSFFASILRTRRLDAKWTQKELGDRIGVTQVTVNRWENVESDISSENQQKIALLFGESIAEFLGVNVSDKESLLLNAWRSIDPSEQDHALSVVVTVLRSFNRSSQ